MPKRKIETSTAKSLKKPRPVETLDPVQELLGTLYSQAIEGNTTAAKLYLDYILKQKGEDSEALTPEEALKILREQRI